MATTTITPTKCQLIKEGTSASGKAWALYEIAAVDRQGAPIEHKMKAWVSLKLGEPVDVEVEKEESEKYGVSYKVSPKRGRGAGRHSGLAGAVDELRAQVEELTARLEAAGIPPMSDGPGGAGPGGGPGAEGPPAEGPGGEGPGDDGPGGSPGDPEEEAPF
jgi:hypothetical protein